MKFSNYVVHLANQNAIFKITTAVLSVLLVVSVSVIFALSTRKPIVIEVGQESRLAIVNEMPISEEEIKNFIYKILPERFDTDLIIERSYFEDTELFARAKEQTLLKERNINQRMLINKIEISNGVIVVNSDRLISVANIKSVLPLKLRINIQRINRSASNPYGLIITRVEQLFVENEKKGN